jgi:glyoxylase-like metal-dependent hydrolase (beta-lactamase superfamily II)
MTAARTLCGLAASLAMTISAGAQNAIYSPDWCRKLPRPEYSRLEPVPDPNTWFQIYRVAPGVYALYEAHQAEEVISYLIVGSKQALLFDTGMGIASIRPLVERLTTLPVIVINSHSHPDHVGGNHEFADILALDLSYTRAHEKGFAHAEVAEEVQPGNICGALPAGFMPASYAILPWKVSHRVHDGTRIALGSRTLEIICLPGHTPDSLALLDREHGQLFIGDTFYPGPIWLFVPETDWNAYKRSVAWLADLAPSLQRLFPAHNVAVASPEVLPRLRDATRKIDSGKLKPAMLPGGRKEYRFEGFSILMR